MCDVCGVEWVCDCVCSVVCSVWCVYVYVSGIVCGVLGEDYVQCVRWKSAGRQGKGSVCLASGFSRFRWSEARLEYVAAT